MKFTDFLRDKLPYLVLAALLYLTMLAFLIGFRARLEIIIVVSFCCGCFGIIALLFSYFRRKKFYDTLRRNIKSLDRAYLVLETLEKPNFYDGRLFYEALYEINKSMAENVQTYLADSQNFREYIELWVHEVKAPIATLSLMSRDRKINEQLKRLDDYVEQVLYFARAQNAERDYYIKETNLAKTISAVAARNQDILLVNNIQLQTDNLDLKILTDAKWLEFILNQILNNSIKYGSRTIKITARTADNSVKLSVIDDGIGINAKDLPRVFDKSFTGRNGHASTKKQKLGQRATGMGLYLAKTLCDKLGHIITISSEEHHGTTVEITFLDHDYYDVTKK